MQQYVLCIMSAAASPAPPPPPSEKYVCTLSPHLVKKAEQELNEKPEWRARDIQALRDMATAHPGTGVPFRVAKFVCLDNQKLSEDNQKLRTGSPPDYEIFFGIYFENSCPYKFFGVFILTLFFPTSILFWELETNRILYGIKMRATKNMSRTTRFPILVVLRLPTFDFMHFRLGSA